MSIVGGWLQWCTFLRFSIITTTTPLSALIIIMSFLFASSSIAFCSPLDRLEFVFLIFFGFSLFRSFCTGSVNVLTLRCVSLVVHFCLFFIWKGMFLWSVLNYGLMSLKWAWRLLRPWLVESSVIVPFCVITSMRDVVIIN